MRKNTLLLLLISFVTLFLSACTFIEPSMQDLKIRAVELKINELEEEVKVLQEELKTSQRRVLTKSQEEGTQISKNQDQSTIQKLVNNQPISSQTTSKSAAQEALASIGKENEKFPMPPAKDSNVQIPPKKVERVVIPPKKVERVAIEKKSAVDKAVTKAGPDTAYKVALNLYRTGKYADSKEAFKLFLKNFPSSSYVVNALYWLGECDYAVHDYTNAIYAFKDVLARFPQSSKTADALLKTALAYEKLNDSSNAALHVSVLYEDWPNSEASKLAQKLNLKPL